MYVSRSPPPRRVLAAPTAIDLHHRIGGEAPAWIGRAQLDGAAGRGAAGKSGVVPGGNASKICLRLLTHRMRLPFSLADASAGSSRAAKMAIIAITISNSISVKPRQCRRADPVETEFFAFMLHYTTLGTKAPAGPGSNLTARPRPALTQLNRPPRATPTRGAKPAADQQAAAGQPESN